MYNGDETLRGENETVQMTEHRIKEYIRCKEDVLYFAEKYFNIVDIDKGKHKITLREYQKRILKAFINPTNNKRHCIMTASRQCGKTTISTIYLTHFALFNQDKTVALLANKEKTAIEILRRIKLAIQQLPLWLQQGISEQNGGWNKGAIGFENGVRMIAGSTASSAIRGESISLLYLDEFAFVPDNIADDFMQSVYPTVSSSKKSKIIVVSCVSDDTYVFTDKGIKQVRDFVDYKKIKGYETNEYRVYGKDKLNKGNIFFNNGKAKTNIIQTTSTNLECSETHKLWACKHGKYGWYESSELEIGDYISIKYGMDIWGSNDDVSDFIPNITKKHKNIFKCNKLNKDISYFLGLYISEGYARKIPNKNGGQIVITCGDNVEKSIKNIGLKSKCADGIHYIINSKTLLDFIEYLGFDINKKAPEKIIPKRLMEMSKENIISLLQGIFDGDGFSRKDKGLVGIGLSSKELVMQIKMLLLNLGILSDYYECLTRSTKLVKKESMNYRIQLDKHNSKLFYDKVGFRFIRKQLKKQFLENFEINKNNSDIVPYSKNIINEFKDSKIRKLASCSGYHKKQIHFSRRFLLEKKQHIVDTQNENIIKFLDDNVSENIKWEPIKKIEKSENYVYDFSLEDIKDDKWCHSVLYNGIIGHQTPNGLNHFYHIWRGAIEPDPKKANNFMPIKINWDEIDGRDKKWKEEIIRDIGPQKFAQEYGCKFLGSSNTLVDPALLERMQMKDPIDFSKLGHCFNIYEYPENDALYIMGVDSAKGTGKDYSVVQVLKINHEHDIKQVAVYRNNNIPAQEFAQICISISEYYCGCYMMVENNEVGQVVADEIWYVHEYDKILNCDKKGIGIRATKTSKLAGNVLLKRYIDSGWLEIVDRNTIYELSRYEEVRLNIFQAPRGHNDDHVTSLLWGLYFITTIFFDRRNHKVIGIDEKFRLNPEDHQEDKAIGFMPDDELNELDEGWGFREEELIDDDDLDDMII